MQYSLVDAILIGMFAFVMLILKDVICKIITAKFFVENRFYEQTLNLIQDKVNIYSNQLTGLKTDIDWVKINIHEIKESLKNVTTK